MSSSTEHVPNHGPTLVIVSSIFLFTTTIFFATRLAWRLAHTQQLGWDDLMASLAYITLLIQTSFGYAAAHNGFGKHRTNLSVSQWSAAMRFFWMYQICYKLLGGFTKLTFCFLYLRIFDGQTSGLRKFQVLVWIVAGIITLGTFAFTLGTILQCLPIRQNWDRSARGHCVSYMAFWFSHAAFNTLMDVVVYVLPIKPLMRLQVAKKTKSGLLAIFALGAFTIGASIARMAVLPRSANSKTDPTWGSLPALVWTEVEANTAVICCCLPALRVVAVRIWRSIFGGEATTPSPSKSDRRARSRGWNWAALPGFSKGGYGIKTEARHSPIATEQQEFIGQDTKERHWLRLPLSSHVQRPESPRSEGSSTEAIVSVDAPSIEMKKLGIRKTTDVQVETTHNSRYGFGQSGMGRDVPARKMVPRPQGIYLNKDRGLSLKEMLDEGPITQPRRSVSKWR